jgi:hypothetical protein
MNPENQSVPRLPAQKRAIKGPAKMTNTKVDKVDKCDNPHFYWVLMPSRPSTL